MVEGLTDSGLTCETAADGPAGARRLEEDGPFDLILLDVMMPGQTGWSFLEELRARGDETPVIFLTARHEVAERVQGLRLGADDYILKPFDFSELLARVDAVQRRHRPSQVSIGDLIIDLEGRVAHRGDRRIELSQREFDVLVALARARGRVISRDELLRRVWQIDFDPGTNVVNVVVARLRAKLGRKECPLIRTVVGEGYMIAEQGP